MIIYSHQLKSERNNNVECDMFNVNKTGSRGRLFILMNKLLFRVQALMGS